MPAVINAFVLISNLKIGALDDLAVKKNLRFFQKPLLCLSVTNYFKHDVS